MAKFGCLLIILACAALFLVVVIPVLPPLAENADVDNYLATLLCEPTESIVREQYSYRDSEGTSYSMDVYCTDRERQQRDVTGNWILIGVASFLVPFLIGLFMFIGGVSRGAARAAANAGNIQFSGGNTVQIPGGMRVSTFSNTPSDQLEYKDGVVRFGGVEIRTGSLGNNQQLNDFIQQWNTTATTASVGGSPSETLTDRLRQLQEARDAGLISTEEYDRLRQEILDKLA